MPRLFLLLFFTLLGAVPAAELAVRGWERLVWQRNCLRCGSGSTILGVRLNQRLWKMFLADHRDLRVLPGPASQALLLPANGSWDAVDFLLPEELQAASRFRVSSDTHGFRGSRQQAPAAAYKVLVLGSYQAFGHGVGDEETYSARLLEALRASPKLSARGWQPVVWNGGMQSATLDRGSQVLDLYLEKLKPDLVILDYGMTDQVGRGMNPWLQPFSSISGPGGFLHAWLDGLGTRHSTGPLGKLYLFTMLVNRAAERHFPENRARFEELAGRTIRRISASGARVLLLDQPVAGMPEELYQRLARDFPQAGFLSVRRLLEEAAMDAPAGGETPPWLLEFPAEFRRWYLAREPQARFLGNILHLNARGHRLLGRRIADWVERGL